MAESKNTICYYFQEGDCRFGDSCRFKHERPGNDDAKEAKAQSSTFKRSAEPCHYFQLGSCSYGDRCKFSHVSSIDPKWVNVPEFVPKEADQDLDDDVLDIAGSEVESEESADFVAPVERKTPEPTASNTVLLGGFEIVPGSSREDVLKEAEPPSSVFADSYSLGTLSDLFASQRINDPLASFNSSSPLCPYAEASIICKKPNCPYLHGDLCDMCNRPVLHPLNEELRKKHMHECLKEYEENMNHSFAVAKSLEETCGICYEKVLEKPRGKSRFGILPECLHCFCLECIRNWRQKDGYEKETSRSCPICRKVSNYVIPSEYWLDTEEEKVKLIQDYKGSMSTIHCKFFKRGKGNCPFNNSCFYLHALPDGTSASEIRRIQNADGVEVVVEQKSLWDFVAERSNVL